MARQTRHECERCGHQWLARSDAFYDELAAWIQYVDEIEADYRNDIARLHWRLAKARDAQVLEQHRQAAEEFDVAIVDAAARLEDEELPF